MQQDQPDTNSEDDLFSEFFQYVVEKGFLTAYDRPQYNLEKQPNPGRPRLALDVLIEFFDRGKFITNRTELFDRVSERKENQESGSQELINKLFSTGLLIPVRRISGGNDDTLLLHGDVINWFSGIINSGADLQPDSGRLTAVMAFIIEEVSGEPNRTAREMAQDAWLYSRMVETPEGSVIETELTHEGKLKPGETPDPNFLLSECYVPESQWGNKYNQYTLEGKFSDAVSVRSKYVHKQSIEEQMATLLTGALYHSGGFWELKSESGEEPTGLESISFDEFRHYLMGLNKESGPEEIPDTYPEQAVEFDTEYKTDLTRTAVYYAIKNDRVTR